MFLGSASRLFHYWTLRQLLEAMASAPTEHGEGVGRVAARGERHRGFPGGQPADRAAGLHLLPPGAGAVAFRVTSSVHFYSSTLTHTCPRENFFNVFPALENTSVNPVLLAALRPQQWERRMLRAEEGHIARRSVQQKAGGGG